MLPWKCYVTYKNGGFQNIFYPPYVCQGLLTKPLFIETRLMAALFSNYYNGLNCCTSSTSLRKICRDQFEGGRF